MTGRRSIKPSASRTHEDKPMKYSPIEHMTLPHASVHATKGVTGNARSPLRRNTSGTAHFALETLNEFAREREGRVSLNEVSSTKHVHLALYEMKGQEFVQEQNGDEATIQILRSLPMAYQVDIVVKKFKKGGYAYPKPDVVWAILSEMEDEAIFGPCVDSLD